MSLLSTGRDIEMVIDARTKKLDIQVGGGNPVFGGSRVHKVMSRLVEHKAAWWADTAGQQGSLLYTVKNLRRTTPSDLEAFARDALAPLLAAREILPPVGARDLRVEPTVDRALGRASIYVGWSTPGGADESLRFALRL